MSDNPHNPTGGADHLGQLPPDVLLNLAVKLGLSPDPRAEAPELIRLIEQRRGLLEQLDRDAMLEVAAWGRRPVKASANKEELAHEIAQVRSMHFAGLSRGGLYVLARLRDVEVVRDADDQALIQALKDNESLLHKIGRKRRQFFGKLIAKMVGEGEDQQYKFLPENRRKPSLKQRIEEKGVVGGLAEKLRGAADDYIAAKLDEIETRIDSKLDEIDRRLAEWRDREIANRLRIIKITLAASVIVAVISLAYAAVVKHFFSG